MDESRQEFVDIVEQRLERLGVGIANLQSQLGGAELKNDGVAQTMLMQALELQIDARTAIHELRLASAPAWKDAAAAAEGVLSSLDETVRAAVKRME